MNWVSHTKNTLTAFMITVVCAVSSTSLFADDIAIFEVEAPTEPPNIMFVMDGSGSMKTEVGNTGDTRMEVLQNALGSLISSSDTTDINIGVMSFANNFNKDRSWLVHGPAYPISPIDGDIDGDGSTDETAQDVLESNNLFTNMSDSHLPGVATGQLTRGYTQSIINTWKPGAGTPIVGALFEAAKYMRGEDVHWGNKTPDEPQAAHPSTYNGLFLATGNTTTVNVSTTEPCGGTTGVVCNNRSTCTNSTTSTTSAPVISETQIVGQDCVAQAYTKTCATGDTFCGDATSAAECTTTGSPASSSSVLCGLPVPRTSSACLSSDPLFTGCSVAADIIACPLATEADCLVANPGALSCTVDLAGGFSCILPVTGETTKPITCDKSVPSTIIATCPATQYSCTLTTSTTTESCTHVVSSSIQSSGVKYKSPIKKECQSNAIILLSDGEPTVNDSSALVTSMIGSTYSGSCASVSPPSGGWSDPDSIAYYGRCGPQLAKFLAESDNSNINVGNNVVGNQPINVYTIGFNLSESSGGGIYLKSLAEAGGGTFATADSSAELVAAFKEAISGVNKDARSFRSPTYTPNKNSMLSHGDVVYLPLFNRETTSHWSGNLKKFKVVNGQLVDSADNSNLATSDTGVLNAVTDEWATGTVSHAVKDGGAASKIDRTKSTSVYTDNGKTGTYVTLAQLDSSITKKQLGSTEEERQGLIDFIRGKDSNGNQRHHMGDVMHSKPVHVEIAGDGYIFVGTNEGYLHAFKEDGTEAFAYMPSEFLKNIKRQKDGLDTDQDNHLYGVDGEITVWKGKVGTEDKVLLFFGLRRGGKAYYALDVTIPTDPSLLWKIDSSMGDYSDLGFTWSKPKIVKIRKSATETKWAMIVGGGYVDDNNGEADTVRGSDVYVIDIENGKKLKKFSVDYAVPGGVRVIDTDRNGLADRLYFADVGGSIWRVDLDFSPDITQAKLYKFADLGGTATPRRKFFNEPDVAFFRHGGQFLISVAIGSGDRANPLSEVTDDRFFALFDNHPFKYADGESGAPTPSSTLALPIIQMSELEAAENVGSTNLISLNRTKKGWYFKFTGNSNSSGVTGEKVLSAALTFDNKVIFSAFGKGATTVDPNDSCNITSGNQSHLYVLDLLKAKPVMNLKDPAGNDYFGSPIDGIPDVPSIVHPPIVDCTVDDCTAKKILTVGTAKATQVPQPQRQLPKVFWLDKSKN